MVLTRQREFRPTEDDPGCILPVDEIREPIEQEFGRILICSLNRLSPSGPHCCRISQGFDHRACRPMEKFLQRIAGGVERQISDGDVVQKVKCVGHPCAKAECTPEGTTRR